MIPLTAQEEASRTVRFMETAEGWALRAREGLGLSVSRGQFQLCKTDWSLGGWRGSYTTM